MLSIWQFCNCCPSVRYHYVFSITQALVDHLNVGVAQAYLNQKRLDSEAKLLHQSATNFSKQTQVCGVKA